MQHLRSKADRQRVKEREYDLIIEDKVSGAIPFFEREGEIEKQMFKSFSETSETESHEVST
jgi:hypothetical protein